MPSTGVWNDAAAIAVVPLAVWLIATGFGLLLERILRLRLANALLAPVGFCLSVVVALAIFTTGAGNPVAIPIMAVLTVAGFVLARRDLPGRLSAGWTLGVGAIAYIGFNLSVIVTGHWTFTGYNIENDSAYELLLVAHLQVHGTHEVLSGTSTANTVISSYLQTGYPLGSQSLLAVVSGMLGVEPAVVWQGFISSMAGIAAMAATTLSGRTMSRRAAALTGLIAVCAALTYQYAEQGSIKEIAMVATLLCALAVIREAIIGQRGARALILAAVPLAAILAVYNSAGAPYAVALAGAGVLGMLFVRRERPARSWVRPAVAGTVAFGILSIAPLLTFSRFFHAANSAFGGSAPTAPELGPLLRPLPLSEMSGVWLGGDYRLPIVEHTDSLVTIVATVVILVLLVPGILRMIEAREPGPLMGLIVIGLVQLIVYPRVSPYAQAKLLVIGSPIVLLCAAQALSIAKRRDWRVLGALVGAGLGAVVLISDAIAYHAWPAAPTARMAALREVGEHLGERGPVLDSEFEQFAKYFTRPALLIDGPDAPTPEALALTDPSLQQYGNSFDLDQESIPFVESFPYILTRRGPMTSRPPANYKLRFRNAFYELWARQQTVHLVAHLPLGSGLSAAGRIGCRAMHGLVAQAPHGSHLDVAIEPPVSGFHLLEASERSPGWVEDPGLAGGVSTTTPGSARRGVVVRSSGSYRVWLQGNLSRAITVLVDGKRVGTAQGENTPGAWLSAGTVDLSRGGHEIEVVRGGGNLEPGDGGTRATLGAVVLTPTRSERVIRVPLHRWRSLCGHEADWVEVVE